MFKSFFYYHFDRDFLLTLTPEKIAEVKSNYLMLQLAHLVIVIILIFSTIESCRQVPLTPAPSALDWNGWLLSIHTLLFYDYWPQKLFLSLIGVYMQLKLEKNINGLGEAYEETVKYLLELIHNNPDSVVTKEFNEYAAKVRRNERFLLRVEVDQFIKKFAINERRQDHVALSKRKSEEMWVSIMEKKEDK